VTNQSIVPFQLSHRGARKFSDETGAPHKRLHGDHSRRRVQGQPPVIPRPGSAPTAKSSSANKPLQEASDLALVLRAGPCRAASIVDERTISASLGADSIHDGVLAGVVGVVLVVVIMIGSTAVRRPGLRGAPLYCLFTLAGLAAFGSP